MIILDAIIPWRGLIVIFSLFMANSSQPLICNWSKTFTVSSGRVLMCYTFNRRFMSNSTHEKRCSGQPKIGKPQKCNVSGNVFQKCFHPKPTSIKITVFYVKKDQKSFHSLSWNLENRFVSIIEIYQSINLSRWKFENIIRFSLPFPGRFHPLWQTNQGKPSSSQKWCPHSWRKPQFPEASTWNGRKRSSWKWQSVVEKYGSNILRWNWSFQRSQVTSGRSTQNPVTSKGSPTDNITFWACLKKIINYLVMWDGINGSGFLAAVGIEKASFSSAAASKIRQKATNASSEYQLTKWLRNDKWLKYYHKT